MLTNLYTAEFGNGGGAIVNVVTKSGTNNYTAARTSSCAAMHSTRETFSHHRISSEAQSVWAFLSGGRSARTEPFSSAITRVSSSIALPPHAASVPTLLERQGDFSQSAVKPSDPSTGQPFPENLIPSNRVDAISQKLLQFYPAPNTGPGLSSSSPSEPARTDQMLVKLDHRLRNNDD